MKQGTRYCLGCIVVAVAPILLLAIIMPIILNRDEDYTFQIGRPEEYYVRIKTTTWDTIADIYFGRTIEDIKNQTDHIIMRKHKKVEFEFENLHDTIFLDTPVNGRYYKVCNSTNFFFSIRNVPNRERNELDSTYFYNLFSFDYLILVNIRGGETKLPYDKRLFLHRRYMPLDIDWEEAERFTFH